jgi:DNA-binding MarR family transcriptional regulator
LRLSRRRISSSRSAWISPAGSPETGTLTPLLKRLESAGFLRRVRDRQDDRQVRVTLTNQGQAIEEQAASIMSELVCAIGQSEERVLALTEEIARLRAALSHHSSP